MPGAVLARRGVGARGAPPAAAKGRRPPELHWSRAEKPRGKLDGAVHPVPRRGARLQMTTLTIICNLRIWMN